MKIFCLARLLTKLYILMLVPFLSAVLLFSCSFKIQLPITINGLMTHKLIYSQPMVKSPDVVSSLFLLPLHHNHHNYIVNFCGKFGSGCSAVWRQQILKYPELFYIAEIGNFGIVFFVTVKISDHAYVMLKWLLAVHSQMSKVLQIASYR